METLYHIYDWIIGLLAFVSCITFFSTDKAVKALSVLLIFTFLFEWISHFLADKYHDNRLWFYIGTPTYLILFSYLFLFTIKLKITPKKHFIIFTVPIVLALVDLQLEGLSHITNYLLAMQNFAMIFMALYTLYYFFIHDEETQLFKNLLFWVWSSFLILGSYSICFWIFYNFMSADKYPILQTIRLYVNIFAYATILVALIMCPKKISTQP